MRFCPDQTCPDSKLVGTRIIFPGFLKITVLVVLVQVRILLSFKIYLVETRRGKTTVLSLSSNFYQILIRSFELLRVGFIRDWAFG